MLLDVLLVDEVWLFMPGFDAVVSVELGVLAEVELVVELLFTLVEGAGAAIAELLFTSAGGLVVLVVGAALVEAVLELEFELMSLVLEVCGGFVVLLGGVAVLGWSVELGCVCVLVVVLLGAVVVVVVVVCVEVDWSGVVVGGGVVVLLLDVSGGCVVLLGGVVLDGGVVVVLDGLADVPDVLLALLQLSAICWTFCTCRTIWLPLVALVWLDCWVWPVTAISWPTWSFSMASLPCSWNCWPLSDVRM